uniref:Uncharacterized protein n=1 Tax=Arundo donax TaxID=35708 RepID=A0A0A9B1M9_ARUDO
MLRVQGNQIICTITRDAIRTYELAVFHCHRFFIN